MRASNLTEIGFLNVLRGQNFVAPARLFARLFLTDPTETGMAGTELSYEGYEGEQIEFAAPTIEGSGIGVRNTEQLTFAKSPINAGTVRYIGIFDAPIGGNMYLYGDLTEDIQILEGEEPVLLINEVLFFSTGDLSTAYKTKLFNVFRGQTITGIVPHCSLWNGNPESGGSELAGENYARVPLTFSAPTEETSGVSIIRNTADTAFNRPTTNWGTWNVTAIYDDLGAGTPIWSQARTAKDITRGIMPKIAAGAVGIGIN